MRFKNIKRILPIILATAVCILGCGGNVPAVSENTTEVMRTDPEKVLSTDLYVAEVVCDSSIDVPVYDFEKAAVPDSDAFAFVSDMGLGWNLGNTFDAVTTGEVQGAGLSLEMSWCGINTTKEMIDSIKTAGFNTIRIPVSWHNHLKDNYEIAERWMDRIEEIVRIAYEDDLYVIINIHHDIDEKYYYPDRDHFANSSEYMYKIWEQIAERFKDYDHHVIFEAVNEPRLVGTDVEWWYMPGNAKATEAIECINDLNQIFVDTVRESGGYNTDRYLMIPSYDQSVQGTMDSAFVLPADTVEGRMILSVHAYTPYDFALNMSGTSVFDESGKGEIDSFLSDLYGKYVCNGIPVVMTEFGALDKNNLQDRVNFTAYYTARAASYGIPVIWWDNNAFAGSGENFGIFNRSTLTFTFGDILNAMLLNK